MISREFRDQTRRESLATALADLCFEQAADSITVADIAERATTSRETFYRLFADSAECFVFLVENVVADLSAAIDDGVGRQGDAEERILAATVATLGWLAQNEARASVILVDAYGGPPDARRALVTLLDSLAEKLATVRAPWRDDAASSGATELMLIDGAMTVLRRLVLAGEISRAPEIAEDIARFITAPAGSGP